MQVECIECGNTFRSRLAPCPDGIDGCIVAHYDAKSFVCPRCGYDSGSDIGKAIRSGRYVEKLGMGIANLGGIRKLMLD